jgi:hypothetical protein
MRNIDPNIRSCDRNFPTICMQWLLPDPGLGGSFTVENYLSRLLHGRKAYINL